MSRHFVVNASPLIVLGKISQIEILVNLAEQLVIPDGVAREIEDGPAADPAKTWLADKGRQYVQTTPSINPLIQGWDLGLGETHVLSWAHAHKSFEAVLDDAAARRCAEVFAIPVRGTLGILLLAKKHGLISEVQPLLDMLQNEGMHIAPSVLATIRDLAGE